MTKFTVFPSLSSRVTKIIHPFALRFPILVGTISTMVPVTEPNRFLLKGILPLELKSILQSSPDNYLVLSSFYATASPLCLFRCPSFHRKAPMFCHCFPSVYSLRLSAVHNTASDNRSPAQHIFSIIEHHSLPRGGCTHGFFKGTF